VFQLKSFSRAHCPAFFSKFENALPFFLMHFPFTGGRSILLFSSVPFSALPFQIKYLAETLPIPGISAAYFLAFSLNGNVLDAGF
jgi:hypothetical protein